MAVQYIQKKYLKYHKGKGFISGHIEALHAMPPAADKFTDIIAEKIINHAGCAGIISTVSRLDCDLNRVPDQRNAEGVKEYRMAVKDIVDFLYILDPVKHKIVAPYLHLSLHGMKDSHYGPFAIEVGTLRGRSCSPQILTWFRESLNEKALALLPSQPVNIVYDRKFKGNESIGFHRLGDLPNGYSGYGEHFHSFQIELARTLRRRYASQLAAIFSEIMLDFQKNFVSDC